MSETHETRVVSSDVGFNEGVVCREDGTIVLCAMDRCEVYSIASDGVRTVLACTGGTPNGATEGADGGIYLAQLGFRYAQRGDEPGMKPAGRVDGVTGGVRVIRPDGSLEWITMDLVSPNDLCFGPDGLLWVTDPTRKGRNDGRIWRVDVASGDAELMRSVGWYPNGIGFGLEDDAVWVASTGEGTIYRIPIESSGGLGRPDPVIRFNGDGHPDGFAFDIEGNIITSAIWEHPAVQVWSSDGEYLDGFDPGPLTFYNNLALREDRTLFICGSEAGQLLAVDNWPVKGLQLHPFRSEQPPAAPASPMNRSR